MAGTSIDFPLNPVLDQEYTYGAVDYKFDGVRWVVQGTPFISNADHTGEVTGAFALTITNEAVVRAKLETRLKGSTDVTQTTGVLNLDMSLGINWNVTLQANVTSITISNATAADLHKTITIKFTGNFTVTIPTLIQNTDAWDDFDGTLTNQAQLYILSVTDGTTITASSTLLNW